MLIVKEKLLENLQGLRSNLVFQSINSKFSEKACNLFHTLRIEDAQCLHRFDLLLMHPQIFLLCCLLV